MRMDMMPLAALMLILGAAFTVPARAEETPDPAVQVESLLDPKVLLHGVVREEDLSLLFAHVRAALLASYQGRDAPPPDELNRRIEAIGGELKTRGMIAGMVLLAALEAATRQALREALVVPAPAAR